MKYILTVLAAIALTGSNAVAQFTGADPGKYTLYNCSALKEVIQSEKTKERELQILMEKSSRGAGGDFVNAIAYRTDYLQAKDNQKLASQRLRELNCPKGQ